MYLYPYVCTIIEAQPELVSFVVMELAWLTGWLANFKNMELTGFIFLCKKIETNLSKAVLGFLRFVIKLFKNISFIFS